MVLSMVFVQMRCLVKRHSGKGGVSLIYLVLEGSLQCGVRARRVDVGNLWPHNIVNMVTSWYEKLI